jgi:hypothetical protein
VDDCRAELAARMESVGPALARAKNQADALPAKEALGIPKLALSAKAEADAMLSRKNWEAREAELAVKRSGLEAVELAVNLEEAKAQRDKARKNLSLGRERAYAAILEALALEIQARQAVRDAWVCALAEAK